MAEASKQYSSSISSKKRPDGLFACIKIPADYIRLVGVNTDWVEISGHYVISGHRHYTAHNIHQLPV